VPLSIRELRRCFPDIWPSFDAVESDLRRRGLMGVEALIRYLLELRPPMVQVEYRRPGVPGPAPRALVSGATDRLQATLESVVGPVSSLRLVTAETTKPEEGAPAVLSATLEDRRWHGEPGQLIPAEDGDKGDPTVATGAADDAGQPAPEPEVRAGAPGSPSSDWVAPQPAQEAFEERSAIVESLAGVCREIAEAFARLDLGRPRGDIPPRAWAKMIDGAGRFIDSPMLANALALGWSVHDLFGCDQIRPYARLDQSGLLLVLGDGRVVAMTAAQAVIEMPSGSRQRWQRRPRYPGRPLIWEVDEPQRRAVGWPR
jgi:hypothetical protein